MLETAGLNRGTRAVLISEIECFDDGISERLLQSGILTTRDLLRIGRTPKLREAVAARSGLKQSQVLCWVLRADLTRIDGVGWDFAELLETCGVCSLSSLAEKDAEQLSEQLRWIKESGGKVGRVPSLGEVRSWIRQAKDLPRLVVY